VTGRDYRGCWLWAWLRRAPDGQFHRTARMRNWVDASNALLRCARLESEYSSMVQFITADIHELPFGSGYLHAFKIDRTLQHVERPALVLREMFRTVRRRSGRVFVPKSACEHRADHYCVTGLAFGDPCIGSFTGRSVNQIRNEKSASRLRRVSYSGSERSKRENRARP
jgi:ubiquinone/menaquinone biosynthesis C-methylase UbiE